MLTCPRWGFRCAMGYALTCSWGTPARIVATWPVLTFWSFLVLLGDFITKQDGCASHSPIDQWVRVYVHPGRPCTLCLMLPPCPISVAIPRVLECPRPFLMGTRWRYRGDRHYASTCSPGSPSRSAPARPVAGFWSFSVSSSIVVSMPGGWALRSPHG